MNLISSEPIFHVRAEVADIRHFGVTPYGDRRVIDITGGRVEGPRLRGRILPGADWQIVCPNGTADLTARYGIETDAGARILVKSDGLRHGRLSSLESAFASLRARSDRGAGLDTGD